MADTVYKRLDYDQTLFLVNLIFQKMKSSPLNTQYTLAPNAENTAYQLKSSVDGGTATVIATLPAASASSAGLLSATLFSKLGGIAEGAQVNTIEAIEVNSVLQTPDGQKHVNIAIPVNVSDLTNDSGFQTAAQVTAAINAAIASVYKPGGSVAFANLPALTAANVGLVVNVNESFTTNANFVEGAGKVHPAGDNVVVINVGTDASPSYKYDVMAGFIDLSGYVRSSQMATMTNQEITTAVNTAYTQVFGE